MSDQSLTITDDHRLAIGVFKFDYTHIGYPELYKIATKWAKMPEFKQVILRKVAKENWGIQFIYVTTKEELNDTSLYDYIIKNLLRSETNAKPYATDVSLRDPNYSRGNFILKHEEIIDN